MFSRYKCRALPAPCDRPFESGSFRIGRMCTPGKSQACRCNACCAPGLSPGCRGPEFRVKGRTESRRLHFENHLFCSLHIKLGTSSSPGRLMVPTTVEGKKFLRFGRRALGLALGDFDQRSHVEEPVFVVPCGVLIRRPWRPEGGSRRVQLYRRPMECIKIFVGAQRLTLWDGRPVGKEVRWCL